MIIDNSLLDNLTAQAQSSPRLRMNFDLRNSAEDQSQRMLNAIEPGSVVSVHRHRGTSETVVVLRGAVAEEYYDEAGQLNTKAIMKKMIDSYTLDDFQGTKLYGSIDSWQKEKKLRVLRS